MTAQSYCDAKDDSQGAEQCSVQASAFCCDQRGKSERILSGARHLVRFVLFMPFMSLEGMIWHPLYFNVL